jgi:RND family efflux transporter MFP subunit
VLGINDRFNGSLAKATESYLKVLAQISDGFQEGTLDSSVTRRPPAARSRTRNAMRARTRRPTMPFVVRSTLAVGCALSAGLAWSQPLAVRTARAEPRGIELVSTQPGSAEAFYEADLGARISGYVAELLVDIGSRVSQGQVLARITVPDLIQSRNAAIAEVAALESEHERIAALVERNAMTGRALTEAERRLDTARARQSEVEALLSYATIEAPFDGIVTGRTIDPGDMVFATSSPKGSDQPLLRIAKVDVMRIKTYVPERESAWVDVGDLATVMFDALPGTVFSGEVSRLSQALDPATRTMLVEIDLANDDRRIRPGYYGQARLELERREARLAIPSSAVRSDSGAPYVYIAAPDDSARRVAVSIGLDSNGWAEITEGLMGDEQVVIGSTGTLADGIALRVVSQ